MSSSGLAATALGVAIAAFAVALAGPQIAAAGEKGEAVKTCDFSRSFITFTTKGRGNNARIQVEALCELTDLKTNQSETFYLVASCKGEDTYGKGRLFLVPSYDFCMVYSASDYRILRAFANAERNQSESAPLSGGRFEDVKFNIVMADGEVLSDGKAVVGATLANRVVNGRCELTDPAGRYRAIIEFPVKTMNVNDAKWAYQVDTGPVLVPDFASAKARAIERFELGFVAFNKPEEAWFVVQEPTPLAEGHPEKATHYSRVVSMESRNSVIALR